MMRPMPILGALGLLVSLVYGALAADADARFVQQFHNACTASVKANADAAAMMTDAQITEVCACSSAEAEDVVTESDRAYFSANQALPDDFARRIEPAVWRCLNEAGVTGGR
ncbi:hypothetical protein [Marinivivus vitaminiproducens]|uniref:hypothetical protein n=1 Tax=Marinivivus vitaminiproducens TaxID=3035935 RepID=UPI0027A8E80A|nr:hypothetical protein P4R82_19130 [Geminicoccaceae bacterium SCSIO 64248]